MKKKKKMLTFLKYYYTKPMYFFILNSKDRQCEVTNHLSLFCFQVSGSPARRKRSHGETDTPVRRKLSSGEDGCPVHRKNSLEESPSPAQPGSLEDPDLLVKRNISYREAIESTQSSNIYVHSNNNGTQYEHNCSNLDYNLFAMSVSKLKILKIWTPEKLL